MIEFTKEHLLDIRMAVGEFVTRTERNLAAFALAQMERAENAEADRDRLREELREAEKAINTLYEWAYAQTYTLEDEQITHYVTPEMAHDAGDPSMAGSPIYEKVSYDFCLAESAEPWRDLMDSNPAIRRALERNK